MKLQWLRSNTGKIIGLAITRKHVVLNHGRMAAREFVERPTRFCDRCGSAGAVLYCYTHSLFLCGSCMEVHNIAPECNYISCHLLTAWRASFFPEVKNVRPV